MVAKLKAEELVVSKWIKENLKKKNMTIGEFADLMAHHGVTRSAVYYYASGERIPSPEVASKIAAELKSPVPTYTLRKIGRPKNPPKTLKQRFAKLEKAINPAAEVLKESAEG